jgi:diguanylate cyclase (GGDEF)-like protein
VSVQHPALSLPMYAAAGWWHDEDERDALTSISRGGVDLVIRWIDHVHVPDRDTIDPVVVELLDALDVLTRQRAMEAAIETDPLTGLGNRRRLARTASAALSLGARNDHPVAFLMIDLDHFKSINDSFGHRIGDVVLKSTAAAIEATVRTYDTVVRSGGEEFVVIAPGTDVLGAVRLAERIRQAITLRCASSTPTAQRITASVGVSAFPIDGLDELTLLDRADAALYVAKGLGRDCVAVAADGVPAVRQPSVPERERRRWFRRSSAA